MGDKEKCFLGFLGLLVSISIFIGIIFCTIDFGMIKVKALSDKMIDYLCKNQYEMFYENLSIKNFTTLDKFTDYQENINNILGDINKYSYAGSYRNRDSNGETSISVVYNTDFSKFSNETVKVILVFKESGAKLQMSDYKLEPENIENNNELTNNINYIASSLKEETKEADDAKQVVTDVMKAYDNRNYKYIYTMLSDELKKQGKEEEFINYLENQHNKYGNISNIKLTGYETNKDKSEYKFNYYLNSDKRIYITLWVKANDKLCLSGIKFSDEVW